MLLFYLNTFIVTMWKGTVKWFCGKGMKDD